jgi:hypothetical protein
MAMAAALMAGDQWYKFNSLNLKGREIVRFCGYNPNLWDCPKKEEEPKIYWVKLIQIGEVQNLRAARRVTHENGFKLVTGFAAPSFWWLYPFESRTHTIVCGGDIWLDHAQGQRVLCCNRQFKWANNKFEADCFWLVEPIMYLP